jgi:acetyl-CoA carboxylase carboxyltransferase component
VQDAAKMFITGPEVVTAVTGERTSADDLGGAAIHATRTGAASVLPEDEPGCLEAVRYLLSFLPSDNQEEPPHLESADPPYRRVEALLEIVPVEPNRAYDVRDVISEIVDDSEYLELAVERGRRHGGRRRSQHHLPQGDRRRRDPEERRAQPVAEYTDRLMSLYVAAERGLVDDIIDPSTTRSVLIESLALLRRKRSSLPHRKHGDVPP